MKKRKYIFLIVILIVFFLIVFLFAFKSDRKLTYVESFIKEPIVYIQKGIQVPISFFKDKLSTLKTNNKLLNDLAKYKKTDMNNSILKMNLKEKNKEISELKDLLGIKKIDNYEPVYANIVNRNIGLWYQTLTIDKGSDSLLKENDLVINEDGLIGKITKLTKNTSNVKLLTSVNNMFQVGVLINNEGDEVFGILNDYKNGLFIVRGLSYNKEIKKDSLVTTSGLDKSFLKGINVGKVYEVKKDEYDLEQIVYVKPCVNYNNINYIAVMRSKWFF